MFSYGQQIYWFNKHNKAEQHGQRGVRGKMLTLPRQGDNVLKLCFKKPNVIPANFLKFSSNLLIDKFPENSYQYLKTAIGVSHA